MKPWEKLAEHRVFDGWRKIKEVEYALPDGKRDMFQIKEEGDCVVALVLTRDRQVVLARQYRVGPEMVLLEMPGGGISVGEHPKDAIAREILEETGYEVKVFKFLRIKDSPNRPSEDRQNVSFVHTCTVGDKVGEADDESSEQKWFQLAALPPREEIAFDQFYDIQFYLNSKH